MIPHVFGGDLHIVAEGDPQFEPVLPVMRLRRQGETGREGVCLRRSRHAGPAADVGPVGQAVGVDDAILGVGDPDRLAVGPDVTDRSTCRASLQPDLKYCGLRLHAIAELGRPAAGPGRRRPPGSSSRSDQICPTCIVRCRRRPAAWSCPEFVRPPRSPLGGRPERRSSETRARPDRCPRNSAIPLIVILVPPDVNVWVDQAVARPVQPQRYMPSDHMPLSVSRATGHVRSSKEFDWSVQYLVRSPCRVDTSAAHVTMGFLVQLLTGRRNLRSQTQRVFPG